MKNLLFVSILMLALFSTSFAQSELKPTEGSYGPLPTEAGVYVYVNKVDACATFYMYDEKGLYMTVLVFPVATLNEIVDSHRDAGFTLTSINDNTATLTRCYSNGTCIKSELIAFRGIVVSYLTTW